MNTKTSRRFLLAGLLAAALAGCTPAGTTGTTTGGCDPNGWGPMSGCGSTAGDTATQPIGEFGCDPDGFGPFSGCGGSDTGQDDTGDGSAFAPDPEVDQGAFAELARHEAAHKAVADKYGWAIRYVEINPDGSGETKLAGFGLPCDCPVQLIAFAVAGEVASGVPASSLDTDLIIRAFDLAPAADLDQLEAAGRAEAKRIVAERADQIDRDAAELLEQGRLS